MSEQVFDLSDITVMDAKPVDVTLEMFGLETDKDGYIHDPRQRFSNDGELRDKYDGDRIHKSNFAILPPTEETDKKGIIVKNNKYNLAMYLAEAYFNNKEAG